jgi:hypothetical protein
LQRIPVFIAFFVACLALTVAATAGGPPVVNSTTHFIDEPFGGVGLNCASGNLALSNGVFSGVIRTLVQADGTVNVSAHTRGTDSLDDVPTDGIVDATTTFVFNANDIVFATGNEVHHFTGTGTLTVTATGAELRFKVVVQVVLDQDGNPKVDQLRFVCG